MSKQVLYTLHTHVRTDRLQRPKKSFPSGNLLDCTKGKVGVLLGGDCVACRMKPEYMGPESPVKMEFKEFCASNAMDSKPYPALPSHACYHSQLAYKARLRVHRRSEHHRESLDHQSPQQSDCQSTG